MPRTTAATTRRRPRVDHADTLAALLRLHAPHLTGLEREVVFAPPRRWRFDFADRASRLAIEVDGGQWAPGGGRHATDADRDKLNCAAAEGWRVLRFSPKQLADDPLGCLALIADALEVSR